MSASCGDGHTWFLANLHDCEQNVLVDVGAHGTLRAYSASRCRKPRRQTFPLDQHTGQEVTASPATGLGPLPVGALELSELAQRTSPLGGDLADVPEHGALLDPPLAPSVDDPPLVNVERADPAV